MADRVKGKVALVTGGALGIGEACCLMLAREAIEKRRFELYYQPLVDASGAIKGANRTQITNVSTIAKPTTPSGCLRTSPRIGRRSSVF